MDEEFAYDVFLSHNSKDKPAVLRSCFKITQGSARQGKNRRESAVYME
jgi:hypothetical protein